MKNENRGWLLIVAGGLLIIFGISLTYGILASLVAGEFMLELLVP